MGDIFNEDFRDFINALNHYQVEDILAGGYSVILHRYSRTTGDLDISVNKTIENYNRIKKGINSFGALLFDMTPNNFLENPMFNVFSYRRAPVSIDLMTEVKGLNFANSYKEAQIVDVENLSIRLIRFNHLIKAKKIAGRPRDLDDLENLSEPK